MAGRSLQSSCQIRATPAAVWRALVEPRHIARWMAGATVVTSWAPGSSIRFTGTLHERPFEGRGTVLVCEPERALRFNHWIDLTGNEDSEQNRTVITMTLAAAGGETRLEVHQDNLATWEMFGHWRFFWRGALLDIREIAEGG